MRRGDRRVGHQATVDDAEADTGFPGIAEIGFDNAIRVLRDGLVVDLATRCLLALPRIEPPRSPEPGSARNARKGEERFALRGERGPGGSDRLDVRLVGFLRRGLPAAKDRIQNRPGIFRRLDGLRGEQLEHHAGAKAHAEGFKRGAGTGECPPLLPHGVDLFVEPLFALFPRAGSDPMRADFPDGVEGTHERRERNVVGGVFADMRERHHLRALGRDRNFLVSALRRSSSSRSPVGSK